MKRWAEKTGEKPGASVAVVSSVVREGKQTSSGLIEESLVVGPFLLLQEREKARVAAEFHRDEIQSLRATNVEYEQEFGAEKSVHSSFEQQIKLQENALKVFRMSIIRRHLFGLVWHILNSLGSLYWICICMFSISNIYF